MSGTDAADLKYLRGLTCLYVEDDEEVRKQLVEFLARRVREVIAASDGAEGLAMFRARRPDLVITDIRMPSMDGLSFARVVRDEAPGLPIIVTTAFDQTDYLMRSIELGIEQYVMKPVEGKRLHATLLTCARRLRLEAESERRRALEADMLRAEAVRMLAGGLAHDYNNLLQVVLGNLTLAREMTPVEAPVFEMLVDAESAAMEAAKLGGRLRVLAGREPIAQGSSAVEPVLRAALADALADSRVATSLTVPAGCPEVRMDGETLTLVVRQIATNASEAMPSGGELHVTAEVVDVPADTMPPLGAGPHVHLRFTDSGGGIPAAVLPRVFDAYFSTKPRSAQRGTGLGLAVSRSLLQRHHGAITAESPPGGGATFHVWIPAATDPLPSA